MTVIVEDPGSTTRTPVFQTTRARWAAAVLVTVGAALQVVEFVLEPGTDDTASRLAWWAEHPDRLAWSQAAGLLAIPFLIGGVAVMVALTRRHSRRLAAAAAVALTSAMAGLAAVHGVEQAARMVAQAGHEDAALAILEGTEFGLAGAVVLVMFLVGALVGTVCIYIAMWRSPYVPRLAVVFGAGFVVMDILLGWGIVGHLAALASGLVLAWAVVTGHVRTPRPKRAGGSH
jgi:hypothetical protein